MPEPHPVVKLWPMALFIALLPLLTIHLCWLIATYQGYLSPCNPYWSDCHSISATARNGVAYFIFKAGMIPAMVLLSLFWWCNQVWLTGLNLPHRLHLGWLGTLAGVALIVYTLSLGHVGDVYYLLRRAGVVTYLGLTFMIQASLSAAMSKCHQRALAKAGKALLQFSAGILILAVASLIVDGWIGDDYKRWENAVEWWLVLLLNLHVAAVALVWRKQNLTVIVRGTHHH